jgi:hypothetical protein
MASKTEQFSVGDIQCVAINDGTFSYPTNRFFSNVPEEQLEGSLRDHNLPLNQAVSPGEARRDESLTSSHWQFPSPLTVSGPAKIAPQIHA